MESGDVEGAKLKPVPTTGETPVEILGMHPVLGAVDLVRVNLEEAANLLVERIEAGHLEGRDADELIELATAVDVALGRCHLAQHRISERGH